MNPTSRPPAESTTLPSPASRSLSAPVGSLRHFDRDMISALAEGTQDGAVKGPRLPRRGVGVDEAFPEGRTEAVEQLIL